MRKLLNWGLLGVAAAAITVSVIGVQAKADTTLDKDLKEYKPVAGISGNLVSVGSDTLNNLMTFWTEGYRKHYPNVTFSVEGKGSTTAPPALTDGQSDLGPMSREMKTEEINAFEKKWGYKPSRVAVAIDALAVFVHKDNPVKSLTMPQVDAIFSSTRKGKYKEDVTKWGQVGLEGDWANQNITLYGRNSASGTYGYFKEHALFKGDFKPAVKEQPGSSTVVQLIGEDRSGAGYSGIGYATAGVRAVPLAKAEGDTAYEATAENCYNGKYPLSRYLYVYFNRAPGKEANAAVREFFAFIHSKEGQEIVLKDGFIPLTSKVVEKNSSYK
ncbi:MAG: phosphate ABC transporter substrate-binding protein [Planctomycetes bacterium]|nr:phosphate ABC transporter substrate-binding protein [Planctomycetota bacterium]